MTVFYGTNQTALNAGTVLAPGKTAGTVRVHTEIITLDTQTTSDTIVVWNRPKGSVFLYGVLNNSATLGASATVAIGITGATGKYRAAAVKTTIVPEVFGVTAANNVATTADEEVFITIAAANLPGSGTVTLSFFYAHD